MTHLTYLEAAVVGVIQGVSEMFPVSSLGHAGDPRRRVLKLPELLGSGSRGPILLGSVLAGVSAYLSVRFLLRYLRTRTLTPFGVYCLVAGLASFLYLGLGG